MKYEYLTRSGHMLKADTAQAILEQLRDASPFTAGKELMGYMQDVAERELIYSGHQLDVGSFDAFLTTAVASGLMAPQ